jgi:CRISPR-associated endoribonuclease Cas2
MIIWFYRMQERRHFLFLYDIKKQSTLKRVSKLLGMMNATRIQYSIFEVLGSRDAVLNLVNQVSLIIDVKEDKIALIPLCDKDFEKVAFFGVSQRHVSPLPDYWIL